MKQMTGFYPGGEIEFLRKKNNKNLSRNKKIRSIRLKSFHITLMIMLFILLGFGAFRAGKFIMEWKALSVTSFRLVNTPRFMKQTVRNILKSYGGNILSIDLGKMRNELISLREVKDVNISRRLPSTLEIKFFLRKPVFQIIENGKVKIIDRDGVVLREASGLNPGLIVIKNVRNFDPEKAVKGLNEISKIKKSIDFITFKNPYGMVIKLKNSDELFYTGEEGFLPRLKKYLKLRRNLIENGNRIKVVDLRFRGRFYLEFEKEVI